jgi:hypothetical protein
MLWRAGAAMVAAALLPMIAFQAPAHAADAGAPVAEGPRVEIGRARLVRGDAPRRHLVRAYPRYRIIRPRIIWHVDASSANPAYVLR